jgi:predicted nucleic acid-binding protein
MLIAIDTNVLVYAEGGGDAHRKRMARDLLLGLPDEQTILPVQVLGELYRVLVGKYRVDAAIAKQALLRWGDVFQVRESTWSALRSALELAEAHQLSIWDSLIFSVAAEQRCRLLLSEDMQEGFTWSGVTVVNPFADKPHALLAKLLKQ